MDIEPHYGPQQLQWGEPMDSPTLHIHGVRTDWVHFGADRSHGRLPDDRPNTAICIVRRLGHLYNIIRERFDKDARTRLEGGTTTYSLPTSKPPKFYALQFVRMG